MEEVLDEFLVFDSHPVLLITGRKHDVFILELVVQHRKLDILELQPGHLLDILLPILLAAISIIHRIMPPLLIPGPPHQIPNLPLMHGGIKAIHTVEKQRFAIIHNLAAPDTRSRFAGVRTRPLAELVVIQRGVTGQAFFTVFGAG